MAHCAGDPRPRDLGFDVTGQAVAADAYHILRAPAVRQIPRDLELDRHRSPATPHLLDERVDAGHEGVGIGFRIGTVGSPFLVHVTPIEEHAGGPILRDVGRPEIFREQAEPPLAPEVDLPEPVARGVVALQEDRIAGAGCVDVRDAPLIDDEFGGLLQTAHLVRALSHGRRHVRDG